MCDEFSEPTFPETEAQLVPWLRDTTTGRDLLRVAARGFLESECRRCQKLRPFPRVLIVARRLGPLPGVEVFCEEGVTVRLEELVDSQDDPIIELLVEEMLVAQLPKSWKHLPNCRGFRQHSIVFTGMKAVERAQGVLDLRALRALDEL